VKIRFVRYSALFTIAAALAILHTVADRPDRTAAGPDPAVEFSPVAATLGEAGGSQLATVVLSAATGVDVVVTTTEVGKAKLDVDYSYTPEVTIPAGETSATLSIDVTNDTADEDDETAIIILSAASGADIGAQAKFTLTITDDDPAPTVGFATSASSAGESTPRPPVVIQLSNPTQLAQVSVSYRVIGGTATPAADYTLVAGTVTILKGQTSRTISPTIVNDFQDETPETVVITLSSPTGAALGPGTTHTLTIADDDPVRTCLGTTVTITGTLGADTITGTAGPDVIEGLSGSDTIRGLGGNDVICGGSGADTLRGDNGADRVDGGTGKDAIEGGNGADVLYGGAQGDTLSGNGASDTLFGGSGADTLRGGGGKDTLRGGDGRDRLAGDGGAGDVCDGGPSGDALLPNPGCETTVSVP